MDLLIKTNPHILVYEFSDIDLAVNCIYKNVTVKEGNI